uniref:Uncharacterized protein n=1 Tax=Arundo donax TaxID=35708 RepID=A0A0A8YP60_ARUDO
MEEPSSYHYMYTVPHVVSALVTRNSMCRILLRNIWSIEVFRFCSGAIC